MTCQNLHDVCNYIHWKKNDVWMIFISGFFISVFNVLEIYANISSNWFLYYFFTLNLIMNLILQVCYAIIYNVIVFFDEYDEWIRKLIFHMNEYLDNNKSIFNIVETLIFHRRLISTFSVFVTYVLTFYKIPVKLS